MPGLSSRNIFWRHMWIFASLPVALLFFNVNGRLWVEFSSHCFYFQCFFFSWQLRGILSFHAVASKSIIIKVIRMGWRWKSNKKKSKNVKKKNFVKVEAELKAISLHVNRSYVKWILWCGLAWIYAHRVSGFTFRIRWKNCTIDFNIRFF